MKKKAVILFNLGGPDSLESVKPFLFNLFNDPAIIRLPKIPRYLLAKFISFKREKIAKEIYSHIGNKSPILDITKTQKKSLEKSLNDNDEENSYKCFIAMRYWKPFISDTIKKIEEYKFDEIILLPLYPQYSTTTTGSSITEWSNQIKGTGLENVKTHIVHSYPEEEYYIESFCENTIKSYNSIDDKKNCRILFSAHGLPKNISDLPEEPYEGQIKSTADKMIEKIKERLSISELDYVICYQSRVGRLEWIGPSLDEELVRAGKDGKGVIIVPISFVSEHSETLVELDIEYRKMSDENNIPFYKRVQTVCDDKLYIKSLTEICLDISNNNKKKNDYNML